MIRPSLPPALITTLAVLLAGGTLGVQGTAAAEPDAEQLVRQLGNDVFSERESAESQLRKLGVDARDALLAGLRQDDPQVRRSCRRMLEIVLHDDFLRRLKAFTSDSQGEKPANLPGWKLYSQAAGDTRGTRKLFASLAREETALLESLESDSAEAVRRWLADVYRSLYNRNARERRQLDPTLSAALLLAGIHNTPNDQVTTQLWLNLSSRLMQDDFIKLLNNGEQQEAYRNLTAAWLLAPSSSQLLNRKLRLALRLDLGESGMRLAARLLSDKTRPPLETAMGVESVARLGGRPHASRLTPMLEDERPCQRRVVNGKAITIEVRDVAIGWLVQLTQQKHADYGMNKTGQWFKSLKRYPQNAFRFDYFQFANDAARKEALEKWGRWSESNPLPAAPPVADPPASPAVAAAARVPQQAKVEPPNGPASVGLPPAERAQIYQLRRAEEAIAAGQYVDATVALGKLLVADEDFYFQPQRGGPLYQQLRSAVERVLSQLPQEGLRAYELRFGPEARAALRACLPQLDVATLRALQRKYFFTEAGAEASYLLATHNRKIGRNVQASMQLGRLVRYSPHASKFEPNLSLQLANCYRLAGLPGRAAKVMQRLSKEYAGVMVRSGGRSLPMPTPQDDPLVWLDQVIGPGLATPLPANAAAGGGRASDGGPYLEPTALSSEASHPLIVKSLAAVQQDYDESHQTALPAALPILADGLIVYRDPQGIHAVDVDSNALRWESPEVNSLWRLLQFGSKQQIEKQTPHVVDGLRRQFWEDPSLSSLSNNGQYVFALEEEAFPLGSDFRPVVVRNDGRREADAASSGGPNRLVAYHLQTGKVAWEIGGSPRNDLPLAGGRFLGPPLCLGGYLYVVVEVEGQSLVATLDAATGSLLNRSLIDVVETVANENALKMLQSMTMQRPDPAPGSSPAYADGFIVCCTSRQRYVSLDLASRSVRWAFDPPQNAPEGGKAAGLPAVQRQAMLQALRGKQSDQWGNYSPIIVHQRVLLTPWSSDQLYCLDLVSGKVAWSAPRQDGLYVAGAQGDRVVVVGRGGARVLSLEDGTTLHATKWPAGSAPSGKGYLTENQLHLPLNSGEVAALTLDSGRLVAHSRGDYTPGNLLRADQWVVSSTPGGIDRLPLLTAREQELAKRENKSLQDYLQLTEVLLYQGKTRQVIDRLQAKPAALQTAAAARLLGDAVLQARDLPRQTRQELAKQVKQSLQGDQAKTAFLRRLLTAQQEAGELEFALQTCWELTDTATGQQELTPVSAARSSRSAIWLQQTLRTLLDEAPAAVRSRYEGQIAERLADDPTELSLAMFGFHPAADRVRLDLATDHAEKSELLRAELLLRRVHDAGGEAERAEAAAKLAVLLQNADREVEAARFFAELAGPLADVAYRAGKTGRELAASLPNERAQAWLQGDSPWTAAVETSSQRAAANRSRTRQMRLPMMLATDGSPTAPLVSAEVNTSQRKLTGADAQGRRQFTLDLQPGMSLSYAAFNQASVSGHLLVAWIGGQIVAVDQLSGKQLWTRDTLSDDKVRRGMNPLLRRRMQLQRQLQLGQGVKSLPQPIVAASDYVLLHQDRLLTAVDPISGTPRWQRDDIPPGRELQGDREVVLCISNETNTAVVLSAIDGRRLGERPVPESNRRLARFGRCLLTSATGAEGLELALVDPWKQADLWSRTFDKKAQCHPMNGCELAVMEPDGSYMILSMADGQPLVEGTLPAEPQLESIFAVRSFHRYLLIANHPESNENGGGVIMTNRAGDFKVEGQVHSIDASSGKVRWSLPVQGQSLRLNHPAESPVIVFSRAHRKRTKVGAGWRYGSPESHLLCLHGATGEVLHQSEAKVGYSQSTYGLKVDPQTRKVEVDTPSKRLTFQFQSP